MVFPIDSGHFPDVPDGLAKKNVGLRRLKGTLSLDTMDFSYDMRIIYNYGGFW